MAARRRATPATMYVAAEADEKRICRQAARGVDDHGVRDEGERECPEAAGPEGARDEQSQRKVAEARDALVGHTPAKASHYLVRPAPSWSGRRCLSGASAPSHVNTPVDVRRGRPTRLPWASGPFDRVRGREAVDLQQPARRPHPG